MTSWSEIYKSEINKKGGLLPFVLNKERRSAGALIQRMRKVFPEGARILEVGTGTGAIGALLTKYGYVVTGIDVDEEMLKIARESFSLFGASDKVFCMDAEDIVEKFGKDSFDCVITHGMLEHYQDEEIISHLKKQLEVAPYAICVVPMKSMSSYYRSRGLGDERYLPTRYWRKLLSKNFNVKKVFGFGFKETGLKYVPERIIKNNTFAKLLAPLCAFNEFWITRNR